jgi:ABC-type glucose/galactose transport system permease subunit
MKRILAIVSVFSLPALALAQNLTYSGSNGLGGLLTWFSGILSAIVPILIAAAVVWLLWNIVRYAIAGDEEGKAKAKTEIIWGIVGLFVMVSIWGLVGVLQNTFQLGGGTVTVPVLPGITH